MGSASRSRDLAIVMSLTALLALCGCTTTAEPRAATTESGRVPGSTVEPIEATPTVTPTPEPVPSILTHAWTTTDGYQWELSIVSLVVTATKDVANAKPGEAVITVTVDTAGSITNLTPGRNADPTTSRVAAVWDAASPACSAPASGVVQALTGTESWCTFAGNLGWMQVSSDVSGIAEGQSAPASNSWGLDFENTFIVPEAGP